MWSACNCNILVFFYYNRLFSDQPLLNIVGEHSGNIFYGFYRMFPQLCPV